MAVLIVLLCIVGTVPLSSSSSVGIVSSSNNCTEGRKAWATLRFTICQKILDDRWCYLEHEKLYETIIFEEYDPFPPNATCSGHTTSCEYLRFLTGTCGSFYDVCHTEEERSQIMGMWIKQFIRDTWSFGKRFQDDAHEVKNGECRAELSEYFKQEEVDELIGLVGTDVWTNPSNKIYSNLTQEYGVLVNETGDEIGPSIGYHTLPSHWKYCTYKLTRHFSFGDDMKYSKYKNFYRCDGKCNTNNGDDQKWMRIDPFTETYFDGRDVNYNKDAVNPISYREGGASECFMKAESALKDSLADKDNLLDKNKAYDKLCKPFEHLVNNCSIPIEQCLGNIAVREVVMANFLQRGLYEIMTVSSIVERVLEDKEYFDNFKIEKCRIFGGVGYSASVTISSSWLIIALVVFCTHLLRQ